MNPPYDRNLHLKILEKVIPVCDEVVNISPVRWLQDPLAKYKKNSDYNKFKESVAEHIKSLKQMTFEQGQELFGIRQETAMAIIRCDNKKYDVYKIEENKILIKIFENSYAFISDKIENNRQDGWRVRLTDLKPLNAGSGGKKGTAGYYNQYELLHRNKSWVFKDGKQNGKHWSFYNGTTGCKQFTENDNFPLSLSFDSEEEAINFEKSTKTELFRYILLKLKINSHTPFNGLPYMPDYSKPWTNKRFCDYFKITGYISDTEAEPGSEWEEILTTMEKYK